MSPGHGEGRPRQEDGPTTPQESECESTPFDLLALTPRELDIFAAGVIHGATVAHDLEHERDEAHAAALHRRAYAVVQAMASIPPRDPDADAERAEHRAAWWAERRGEVAS